MRYGVLIAHKLYNKKHYVLARMISQVSRFLQELKFILEQKSENVYLLIMVWV